jgi:hypothetical protein
VEPFHGFPFLRCMDWVSVYVDGKPNRSIARGNSIIRV